MLRDLGVRFIIINGKFYEDAAEFDRVVAAAKASSRLWPVRTFGSGGSRTEVFELNYLPE